MMGSVMPSEVEASLLGLKRGEIPRLRKASLGMTTLEVHGCLCSGR